MKKAIEVFGEPESDTWTYSSPPPKHETAVFIMPDRVQEILTNKENPTIDDVLI